MNALAWQTLKFRTRDWTLSCAFSFSLSLQCSCILILCQSPLSSRFKTRPQDSTSRSTCSGSLLFYSSDFCWSPFTFNVRELSYLKNLVHPGTVYSISSVDSNPSLNSFHWSSPLFWYTLHCLRGRFATTLPPSNSLYRSPLLSFVRYALHRLIPFPVNPLIHL